MNEKNNTYYQQQHMGQPMMPPPMARMQARGRWQRRAMNVIGRVRGIDFPKWLSQYAIVVYIMALMVVTFMYSSHSMPWYYVMSGAVSIGAFFLYGRNLSQQVSFAHIRRPLAFEKRIFRVALILRVFIVVLMYALFQNIYGNPFGFENGDALYYDELGQYVAGMISRGDFHFYDSISRWSHNDDISDMGYGVYLGFIYFLTGNSIIVARLLKCIMSAWTVVLIYRLARRNFGEQTGRMAAVFVTLWPNFWYYCSAHLKEVEMVFLAVLFVEQAEQMLRSRQFTAWKIIPILLIAAAMFTFRTPLGLVALLALVFSVVMSSSRVVSWGKRIIVGLLAVALIGVVAGNRIQEKANHLVAQVQSGEQQGNMEWRGKRDNGNAFAKYAGATVFAPMIFTLPFPSMVRPFDGQDVQQLLNGGNFIKNIISFCTIFAVIALLLSGKWREHLLPLSFMVGYLAVLTMSTFAHSERFHQPAMPFELMFAAYGLSVVMTKPKYKRWYMYWCVVMFVAAIAWNWFKLKGRGL